MRDVAIVSYAQSKLVRGFDGNEIELLLPVVAEAIAQSGLARDRIGFSTLASSDFMAGQAFAFVRALDAMGVYPVANDSHLDMDGAFALYEAWVQLQAGEADAALVVALGRCTTGVAAELHPSSLDPYYLAPLGPDAVSLAALSARALLTHGLASERDFAAISTRTLANAADNPWALSQPIPELERMLDAPHLVSPLRAHDCAQLADGAAALVIASAELAREVCERPVWIRGFDHRIDVHALGQRDLTRVPSATLAAAHARVHDGPIDVAELSTAFAHEEILLRRALELEPSTRINPSGGPFGGHAVMATGLVRVGEAWRSIVRGEARRALAHATSGPCLQQNLVVVLEGSHG